MVVELSATPKGTSNKLISVSGRDLEQEQMLKLDLHVTNEATWDWRDTLRNAVKKRAELEETARAYEAMPGAISGLFCLCRWNAPAEISATITATLMPNKLKSI